MLVSIDDIKMVHVHNIITRQKRHQQQCIYGGPGLYGLITAGIEHLDVLLNWLILAHLVAIPPLQNKLA